MKVWMACLCLVLTGAAMAAEAVAGNEPASAGAGGGGEAAQGVHPGRYQLVVVPAQDGNPYLLDTATGCIWHQVQDKDTKRMTFVEVDVNNLHWSWGSGAQSILANRIDASNLEDKQKKTLKEGLQKTACGLSNIVLTPGPPNPGQGPKTP
jgi:hypothetical protein